MQVAPVGAAQTYQPIVRPAAEASSALVVQGTAVAPEARTVSSSDQSAALAASTVMQVTPDAMQVAMQQAMAGLSSGSRF
jgi:hypothetical protein